VHEIWGFDKVQPAESAGLVNLLKRRLSGISHLDVLTRSCMRLPFYPLASFCRKTPIFHFGTSPYPFAGTQNIIVLPGTRVGYVIGVFRFSERLFRRCRTIAAADSGIKWEECD
jgi:hypothetical protein